MKIRRNYLHIVKKIINVLLLLVRQPYLLYHIWEEIEKPFYSSFSSLEGTWIPDFTFHYQFLKLNPWNPGGISKELKFKVIISHLDSKNMYCAVQ